MTLREQVTGVWSLVVSANFMRQGRPAYSSGDPHEGTKEEMAEAAFGYLAYAGKFEVNEETNTLIHHVEVSMNPTWLGKQQPRVASIEGDILSIYNGLKPNQRLVWKRVGSNISGFSANRWCFFYKSKYKWNKK